ncbi:unnamed protein product, partial [Brenthis ino]
MNFVFVLFVISLFWRNNNCGLVTNLLGTVANEVNKINKGDVVETLSEETKEIADDLGGFLSLRKSTEPPKSKPAYLNKSEDEQANSHEILNKKEGQTNKIKDERKTTQAVESSEDIKEEIKNISTLTDEDVSKESDISNEPDEFETTTDIVMKARANFVGGCLKGFAVALDGTCQEIIID